ncbi:hypothetical protein ANCCAN_09670 [Ancylostoma caninum]|uniref:Tissue inhibitor of metalloproteinase n=1 Tax=Ancylostoma caninum TaxID=29170 RepID=A0A368GIW3_ANCCA|nr:hypothetical protein ANCCAN_09670 [Ancylostoma caninum]
MWYLIAFLVCLQLVLGESPECICSKTHKLDESALDFIITTEIKSAKDKEEEDGSTPYEITNTRVIKPTGAKNFSSTVYTNLEKGWFNSKLCIGTRFILEGIFHEDKPMVTSCELLRKCEKVTFDI